ncbi:hypothetical protein [Providencia alcalifaciens]|uniref:hypothetical protein n=1 Tax=Providencia alcalifaciens TaxID=126385 RepID=UPI0003E28896|nr:hypothetical protein [Providencia alcalifaciens]ETS99974.1 hypothetical protein HMPREF1568_0476 [Providencia alcalifaciens PAL-3]EUD01347.1 hypothetical protein HMPREF1566_3065 [Providencia alcalifaciens PAL-1]
MCGNILGGTQKIKTPPAVQAAPQEQDEAVVGSRDEELRRRRAAAGRKSTLLTGAQGATGAASTSGKTLLGQ